MSLIHKKLLLYIDIALAVKKEHLDYPVSETKIIKMAIDMDNIFAYGMGKLERDKFLKSLGRLFG